MVPFLFSWQDKFNRGSEALATDHDTKIPLNDPNAATSDDPDSTYRVDDVPMFVEFDLREGPTNYCYYTRSLLPVFPAPAFGPTRYFHVKEQDDLYALFDWTNANAKIVKTLNIPGTGPAHALTDFGVKPASMVFAESAGEITCVHEWGHACGLRHRGVPNVVPLNPGPTNNAVMQAGGYPGRNKINRYERTMMYGY